MREADIRCIAIVAVNGCRTQLTMKCVAKAFMHTRIVVLNRRGGGKRDSTMPGLRGTDVCGVV